MEFIQYDTKDWFKTWFDSPYYEILYKNRNEVEAKLFIDKLIKLLSPNKKSHFLDLCCGKGRHSRYINSLGYKVDGTDLSERNINSLIKYNSDKLNFFQSDMRKLNINNKYEYIFNLFTSFGYFDNIEDDLLVAEKIHNALKINGIVVIDFINMIKAIENIQRSQIKKVDNISFKITKKIDDNYLYKNIEFCHKKVEYNFTEKVKILKQNDFIDIFEQKKLKLIETYGDYELNQFNNNSERLILIFKKLIN